MSKQNGVQIEMNREAGAIYYLIAMAGSLVLGVPSGSLAAEDAAVFDLGEVTVSSTAEVAAPYVSEAVVTAADIEQYGAQTVAEALHYIPGVYMQSSGKNSRHVNIRGFSESELKVLVDGIPANETYFRQVDLSQFPASSISEIRVTKGLPSVLYGANSMGGVVNIITKKGAQPSVNGTVQFSDYSTMHSAVSGGGQWGPVNMYATYAYQTSDGFSLSDDFDPDDPTVGKDSPYHEDGGVRDNSDYIRRSLSAKTGYDTELTKVYLSFDWHNNEGGIPVEYNRYWRFKEWEQWHLNLVGEQQLGAVTLKAQAYYFKHDDDLEDDAARTVACGGKSWFDESVYDDYAIGGFLQGDWNITDAQVLRTKVDYSFEQNRQRELNTKNRMGKIIAPGWSDDDVYETEMIDLAVEYEGRMDRLSGTLGVSYDLYRPVRATGMDDPGDDIQSANPQLTLRWDMNDALAFVGGAGRKTRFPHMKELYSSHAGGNADLDPEHTDSVEAGVQVQAPEAFWFMHAEATVFNNDIQDMILSVDTPDGESQYQNIGRAVTRGVELALYAQPLKTLEVRGGYTWLHAEDEDLDRRLQQLPAHRLFADGNWQLWQGFALSVQIEYNMDSVEYLYDKNKNEYEHNLPDYMLLNAGVEQQIGSHAKLFARVDNMFDRNYNTGNGPMPGRQVWGGVSLDW